jgi:hypothetical protein
MQPSQKSGRDHHISSNKDLLSNKGLLQINSPSSQLEKIKYSAFLNLPQIKDQVREGLFEEIWYCTFQDISNVYHTEMMY